MNSITKDDFLKMVRLQHLEVITQNQLHNNTQIIKSYMEKSLISELSDIEKGDANMMIEDLSTFQQWSVISDDFSKAICYTRSEQIEWEEPVKGEFGEIVKAKGGIYKPTGENKKLGRVGQKYGEKEEGNMPTIRTEAQRREYEKRKEKESGGAFIAPKYKDERGGDKDLGNHSYSDLDDDDLKDEYKDLTLTAEKKFENRSAISKIEDEFRRRDIEPGRNEKKEEISIEGIRSKIKGSGFVVKDYGDNKISIVKNGAGRQPTLAEVDKKTGSVKLTWHGEHENNDTLNSLIKQNK